ncbi:hypothetical protein Tco_1445319, partial [Tanacetum coccineum]
GVEKPDGGVISLPSVMPEKKTMIEMENVGLTFAQVSSKAHREGLGIRVADSHIGNHPEGRFTPFETIRRLLVVIGRKSHSGFEGETFEPKRRVRHQASSRAFG